MLRFHTILVMHFLLNFSYIYIEKVFQSVF